MINLLTSENNDEDSTRKISGMVFIIVLLFWGAHYLYKNEYLKSEGIVSNFIFIIFVGLGVMAIVYLILLLISLSYNYFKNSEAHKIDIKELTEKVNLKDDSNSVNKNILHSEIASLSKIVNKNRMLDELYKVESNEENQKNNNDEDNLMTGIFEMFSENEIYKKGKGTFGLESYSFESKTQLAVILCVIKFGSHKDKFSNLPQNKFLLTFKENFKNGFSLGDKEFKDKINFTESFFSSIKKDLFEFDKMNNKNFQLNQNSQYYQLYNDFLKILTIKDI